MPNWVSNIVTIEADNVDEIIESLEGENGVVDFSTIVPMPKDLMETTKGFFSDEDEQAANQKKIADNLKNHGFETWYEFSIAKWGTKWNACEPYVEGNKLFFETAWSTPASFIEALSEKFPDATFECIFADEDVGYNCGTYTVKGGVTISVDEAPYGADVSPEVANHWRLFAMKVKGWEESEIIEFFEDDYEEH